MKATSLFITLCFLLPVSFLWAEPVTEESNETIPLTEIMEVDKEYPDSAASLPTEDADTGYAEKKTDLETSPGDTGLGLPDWVPSTPDGSPLLINTDEVSVGFPATATSTQAPVARRNTETLSVDFPDEEIRTILRNVADLFELNLVIPDTLQGRTSIKLREVTWRQIFDVILSPVQFTWIEEGNIIKVVSRDLLSLEPPITEVFILNYAKPQEISGTIGSMVDASLGGRVQIDRRSNALVITERPSQMNRIRPIIEQLDKPNAQIMIETKFVEVTDRDVKNIGVNWASLSGYGVGVGNIQREYTKDNFGERENDRVRSSSSNRSTTPGGVTETLTEIENSMNSLLSGGGTNRVTSAVFNADQFQIILSALKTQNETRLVSNPTVVTMNNQEALISIGEQFPVPNYTYNQERGTFEVSGFNYRDIGVIMRVTPSVNSAGMISLRIEPEVSSRAGTTSFGGAGGAEIPIIATRRTSTNVTLKDGFTMGLGGLIEHTSEIGQSKVPLLGDIPGLGRLFRSDSKSETRRNLVVFITAKTLTPDGATYQDVFDSRLIEKMAPYGDVLSSAEDKTETGAEYLISHRGPAAK